MSFSLLSFKAEIISLFREGKDEIKNLFDIGLSDYIENYFNKLSLINTFLFPHEKVQFYDVFFPLDIETKSSWHKTYNLYQKINSLNLLEELFTRSHNAAIIGYAGSGKTMLVKFLFLECCNSTFFKKVPILIELRALNNFPGNLREYIYSILTRNKIKPSSKILERSLVRGNFMFLFDGYDELKPELFEKVTHDIEVFIDEFNKNYFVITSRPGSNAENLSGFISYYVEPLSEHAIFSFLRKQLIAASDTELFDKISNTINDPKNFDYKSYLSNPLLLSMLILTYSRYPELPKSKSKFYSNVIDTLVTKHDSISKRGGYKHPRKSNMPVEDYEEILKSFSYISFFESKYEYDYEYLKVRLKFIREKLKIDFNTDDVIYDVSVSLSILLIDGHIYKYPHRTLQDYLAISFIKNLDDNAKKKIYGEKLITFFDKNSSVNTSFISLCIEMDKHAFYKYFIKEVLGNFLDLFEGLTKEEELVKLMKCLIDGYEISQLVLNKRIWSNSPHHNFLLVYSLLDTLDFIKKKRNERIIELDIKNKFIDLFQHNLLNEIKQEGYLIKQDDREYLQINNLPDELLLQIIKTYKLDTHLQQFLERVKIEYLEANSILSQDIENLNSIWNFSSES